jgi:tRNA threonylcarbamoyl adenosine modification protein YeaZ
VLLAIDTSTGTSVAVVDRDGGVLAVRTEEDSRRHAEVIGDLITRCLKTAGVSTAELSGVAVGMGPGPFTGLRVGIAAANTFAFGLGKPVVRVVSHDAVAFAHYAAGASGPLLVVTDARRRQVYWSAYSGVAADGIPERVAGPELADADLSTTDILGSTVADPADYLRLDTRWVSAGGVGMLAEMLHLHHKPFAAAQPLYLRSPDVTLATTVKRVS